MHNSATGREPEKQVRLAAWIATYAAVIAATSMVPTIPYPTGGGILPLSVSLVVLAPAVLGVRAGLLAALLGGVLGSFVSPAAYPFGVVDAFFMSVFPALCSAAVQVARGWRGRMLLIGAFVLSGLFAELVPYVVPGVPPGVVPPVQPLYAGIVALFCVPWVVFFATPAVGKLHVALRADTTPGRLVWLTLLFLAGLMLWSLWQMSLWALAVSFQGSVALGLWLYALASRVGLAIVAAAIAGPLLRALRRSSFPAPPGVPWADG